MKNTLTQDRLIEIAKHFALVGDVQSVTPYGNGHINDTFLAITNQKRYILQRMNTEIFTKPDALIENIEHVTDHLRKIIRERGGDETRETLTLVQTKDGLPCLQAEDGYFRVYDFLENSVCFEKVEKTEDFYNCGMAFGAFQKQLSSFPAETLHEVIENFHNTVWRFENLKKAVEEDKCGRKKDVLAEIEFAFAREKDCHVIVDALAKKEIPLRVTHNDTKLNNIMFDEKTQKPLCVIDLDTVMPGSALYDYGDSIRFGANTGAEDETDLSRVGLDLELYKAYTDGYIKGCDGALTEREISLLPMGAKLMTLECGMRFLTDYLEGDTYFKIHRPNHNLDRCRTQFKLVADMEEKLGV